jgi:hypothetical protein
MTTTRDPHGPTLAGDALRMLGQQLAAERAAWQAERERLLARIADLQQASSRQTYSGGE